VLTAGIILIDVIALLILGIVVHKMIQKTSKTKVESLEKEAEEVLIRAKKDAETAKKESILEAKEELH
jgi:ribonuclease Y